MRPLPVILLCALVLGCAGRPLAPDEGRALLDPHVADARAGSRGGDGAASPDLTAFEAQVLEIRAAWEKRLKAPAALSTFHDFGSSDMAALVEEASRPDFAGSLADEVTLDRVLAGAFSRNPGLEAARKRLAGTIEQYAQVTYLDDIMRQYVSFLRSLHTRVGPTVPMDDVAKDFPFPGTLELKAAIVEQSVEEARARYEVVLRDLVTDVRVAFADYVFSFQAIENTQETLHFLRQLEETTRTMLTAGRAEKSHVIQTQVQISQLENDLLTLERQQDTIRARLRALLDLPPDAPIGAPLTPALAPFPADPEALEVRARKEQPEILAAEARAARMATMIELAEQAAYPDLSPGLSTMEGLSHETGGSAKEREPFGTTPRVKPDPFFGTKEAYLREAREGERAARASVVAVRNQTGFRVREAYNQLETARRLYELYRDVQLAQAEQAYRDASSGYAADRVEFLNVIDALRQWLRFLLDRDRAVRDYHQAHARLESAVGGPVPRLP